MAYKPTGNPPGRPRTRPVEAKAKPAAPKVPTHPATPPPGPPPAGREHSRYLSLGELCAECFPDGWQPGWTGIGCPHGSWVRRIS